MALTREMKDTFSLAREQDLPEGWTLTHLEDICAPPQYGWTTSAVQKGYGLKLLRTTDISGGAVDWSKVPGCREEPENPERYLLSPGDIVVSRAGSVGVSDIIKDCPKAIFASYLIRVRPLSPIPSEFIAYFFHSPQYWDAIAEETSGITIPNVNASKLKRLLVPLPPLAEQKRIVAKIEELLARVSGTRERLAKVPALLRRFRQAVLAAACSGRLTEDLRGEQVVSDTWRTVKLSQAAESRLGKMLDKVKNRGSPTPYLRNINVRWFDFDLTDIQTIRVTEREATELSVREGDVFVCEGGEPGRCAVWRGPNRAYVYQKALHRVQVGKGLKPEWLCYCLKEAADSGRLAELFTGTTIKHLTGVSLRRFEFPLPSPEEQHEIVRRVEALLKLADITERRVGVAKAKADGMIQAILAKAFGGDLVATEADLARREGRSYEPALNLLAHINGAGNV
jgi:type I restriction enzyme S subunit